MKNTGKKMKMDKLQISEQMNEIINRIKKERIKQKLSQLELSLCSGVSQNMIAYIESGKRIPSLITFLKLCSALKVNPIVFFQKDEDKKNEIKNRIVEMINQL